MGRRFLVWCRRAFMGAVLFGLAISPHVAAGQGLRAKIVDATNGRPIRDAEVQLLAQNGGLVKATLSDRNGRIYLAAPVPGVYLIAVQRLGYPATDTLRVHLEEGRTLSAQLALEPKAIELDGVTVTAEPIDWSLEMVGFYNRQRSSVGYFKEVSVRDERRAINTVDYFRMASGVQVNGGIPLVTRAQALGFWGTPDAGGQATAAAADPRNNAQGGGARGSSQCLGLLIIDGIVAGSTAELNFMVSPHDVAAIEVHANPATAPPQWRVDLGSRGSFSCGIFAVWTKRGAYARSR